MKPIEKDPRITGTHLARLAYVYVRQSSLAQVENNQESTRRQLQLVDDVVSRGWSRERVVLIDEDQGHTATLAGGRRGFERLLEAVAKGEVGVIAALEASRLARNSPDWAQLIYIARYTCSLIADETGIYDPTSSTDRMVLGIRGQISEIEIDTSIHPMIEARWNKAKRGEMVFIPPAGFDIDDLDKIVKTTDEQVAHAIQLVFTKFDELGSARQVFVWWQGAKLNFPVRRLGLRSHPIVWMEPRYRMIYEVLRNPIYAGAYVYGKNQRVRQADPNHPGKLIIRTIRRSEWSEWPILIEGHHEGYVSFAKWTENRARLQGNQAVMKAHGSASGPAREGGALLQGVVRCGTCGRGMVVSSSGARQDGTKKAIIYLCKGAERTTAKCQYVNGRRVDDAVVRAFLEVVQPRALEAAARAEEQAEQEAEDLSRAWQLRLEKAEYEAQRAERQFQAVEPENRIVARELERRWNARLVDLERLRQEASAARAEHRPLEEEEKAKIQALAEDIATVWEAETTTNRDRKRLLRCLIEEVQLRTERARYLVRIVWKGGAAIDLEVKRNARGSTNRRTAEDTVELIRKLAQDLDDAQIARVLNRQGRRRAFGAPFTRGSVSSIRRNNDIPCCPRKEPRDSQGGPFTAQEAARELGVTPCTIYDWIRDGVLPAKQLTAGAPWRIRLSDEQRARLSGADAPAGWVRVSEAARRLGVSTSRVVDLVRRGKLRAVHTRVGKRRCWKVDVSVGEFARQADLFEETRSDRAKEA
jgi:excisionase family DNA binding protein